MIHVVKQKMFSNVSFIWSFLSEDNLFRIIIELFVAGTDTTSVAIGWSFLHLIKYPEIQDKCRKEIMKVWYHVQNQLS